MTRRQSLTTLTWLDRQIQDRAASDLEFFIQLAWPVIEPHTRFTPGWHIGAICWHLEALMAGQIRSLLILTPRRMSKSLCTSLCLTPWTWIRRPGMRFMFASYSASLSVEHAVTSRRIIDSPDYQMAWGSRYQLTTDQNIKAHYENTERGFRISTSVGGTVPGRGADVLVLDDPHNLTTVHSEVERAAVLDFYKRSWHNAVNDPATARRVCIMQRAHPDDLASHLMGVGYDVLELPNEYDPARSRVTGLGWRDPRHTTGELLCEARLNSSDTEALKKLAPEEYQAQFQQDPAPAEGRMFRREWFEVCEALPADVLAWVRFWDVAGTRHGRGPRTAGMKMGRTASGKFVIAPSVVGRWTEKEVDDVIQQTARLDGVGVVIREEQEPGSSGLAVVRARARALAGYDYRGVPTTGDKVTRARPLRAQAQAGNVLIIARTDSERAAARDFIEEISAFPYGLKDQVDAAAGAFTELMKSATTRELAIAPAGAVVVDESDPMYQEALARAEAAYRSTGET